MVSVAQLVERQTVNLTVAGSNPVVHPNIVLTLASIIPIGTVRIDMVKCPECGMMNPGWKECEAHYSDEYWD